MRSIGSRVLAAVVVTGLVTVLTLSEAIASASAATAPVEGVTSDSVKIGFIYSKTGVASATSGDFRRRLQGTRRPRERQPVG